MPARRMREEAFTSKRNLPTTDWSLSNEAMDQIIAKKMRRLNSRLAKNTQFYINARTRRGIDPLPRYIISPVGITDHPQKFGWSWFPPARGVYTTYPKGKVRKWTYIFLHSYGYTWDLYYMRKNRRRRFPPGDEFGHHPSRHFSAIQQLCALNTDVTKPKKGSASIHFFISRRGDVACSVDLNDKAWHGGGDVRYTNANNNEWSVGFEVEPALGRYKYNSGKLSRPLLLPYSKPQMLALAIVCQKLVTYRGAIKEVYISKRNAGSLKSQSAQHGSGYIQHNDVSSKKVDIGGEFNILPGTRGLKGNPWLSNYPSGWDTLWDLMRPMRFALATDIFVKDQAIKDFQDVTDMSVAMMKTKNAGQRAVAQQYRDRMLALHRASSMQAQERRFIYKQAAGQSTTLSDVVAKSTANVSKQVQQFSVAGVTGVQGPVQTFDYETGTWKVGGSDTGKAT